MERTFDRNDTEFTGVNHGSRAILSITSSTGTYLNGSLLPHRQFVHLQVVDPDGNPVCDVNMTNEQLARLLTANTYVDVTLRNYRDSNGDLVSEYVPEPLRIDERVGVRLDARFDVALERLNAVRDLVNASKVMSGKAKQEIDFQLKIVEENLRSDAAFTVSQALEEVEEVTGSLLTGFSRAANEMGISPEIVRDRLLPPTHEGKRAYIVRTWDWTVNDARIKTAEDVKRSRGGRVARVYAAGQDELDQIIKGLTRGKPINAVGGFVVEIEEDRGGLLPKGENKPAELPE